MSQQNLNKIYGQVAIVEEVSAGTTTLDKYDTGKVLYVNASSAVTVTLPNTADTDLTGWSAKFIVKDGTGTITVSVTGGTATLEGSDVGTKWTVTSDTSAASAAGTVTGDTCEIVCVDGTVPAYVASCTSQA